MTDLRFTEEYFSDGYWSSLARSAAEGFHALAAVTEDKDVFRGYISVLRQALVLGKDDPRRGAVEVGSDWADFLACAATHAAEEGARAALELLMDEYGVPADAWPWDGRFFTDAARRADVRARSADCRATLARVARRRGHEEMATWLEERAADEA